jgi:hypothetical protein
MHVNEQFLHACFYMNVYMHVKTFYLMSPYLAFFMLYTNQIINLKKIFIYDHKMGENKRIRSFWDPCTKLKKKIFQIFII